MPSKKQIAKDTVQIQSSQFPLAFSLDKVTSGGASLFHEEVELKYIVSGNLTMLFDNKSISAQAGLMSTIRINTKSLNIGLNLSTNC